MTRELKAGRVAPASGAVKSVVVFLHGYGADGADLLAVIHDLFAAPDIAGRAAHYQQLFTKATS